jgi:hypothetical protein
MAHNVHSIVSSSKMKWQHMPIVLPTKVEYPEPENRLGCARCLVWGLVFKCPCGNLPELSAGRWGQGLPAEKMKECVWVRPEVVARIEFLEWTGADHLRHTKIRCTQRRQRSFEGD